MNRGGSARHAVDRRTPFVAHDAAGGFHQRIDESVGVEVADTHQGLAVIALDQPLLDGERAHGTQHVAAVGGGIDAALGNHHLHEQVVDVGVGMQRRADDGHLARLRAATADAVDLKLVTGAHQVDQQLVALDHIGWQIPRMKERAFGGTAAHEHTRNSLHDY
ncbi:hypothetical protein D3C81_1392960 [compost metagenome]